MTEIGYRLPWARSYLKAWASADNSLVGLRSVAPMARL